MKKTLLYLFFAVNLGIIIYFWYITSGKTIGQLDFPSTLLAIGRLCGLMAVLFALLQFTLMGRENWIERVFGLDKLSQFHHWNGYATYSFIVLHATLVLTSYATLGKVSLINQAVDFFLHYEDIWQAEIAVVLFSAIVFFSVYIVRKHLKYEWWYGLHLFTYVAIILAWGHQLKWGSDFHTQAFTMYWYGLYTFVALNVLYFRFTRPLLNFLRFQFHVQKVEAEGSTANSVYVGGNNLSRFKTTPGQFVILRFLNKDFWQAHPFSLSFVPKNNTLRVTIKKSGDFTNTIGKIKPGTRVFLDGPFGSFRLNPNAEKFLFIAGGVGITPIRSLLEQAGKLHNEAILLYSNRTGHDIILKDEIDALSKEYGFRVIYIVTNDPSWKGETGRIDEEKLKRLVPDLKNREVYICGPVPMTHALQKRLLTLGVSKQQLHFEKFSLH